MTSNIRKSYQSDCLLVDTPLANNKVAKRLRSKADLLSRAKMLCDAITAAALSYGLYFRVSKPLAIISGAGIAGLAASFELRARGFNVVIVENEGVSLVSMSLT